MGKFNFDDFAKGTKRAKGGIRCQTCQNTGAAKAIHDCLTVWAKGDGEPHLRALHKLLEEHEAYTLTFAAMYRHIRMCERDVWEKVESR